MILTIIFAALFVLTVFVLIARARAERRATRLYWQTKVGAAGPRERSDKRSDRVE